MDVGFLEGIQPIEAEHRLSVRPLHQGELAAVDLDLDWSCAGRVFLLSPRTFGLAGAGKQNRKKKRENGIDELNTRDFGKQPQLGKSLTPERDRGLPLSSPPLPLISFRLLPSLRVSPPRARPPLAHRSPRRRTPESGSLRKQVLLKVRRCKFKTFGGGQGV